MTYHSEKAVLVVGATAVRLRNVMEQDGMTVRNVATFAGVDKSVISRFVNRHEISVRNYLALVSWLDEPSKV